MRMTDLVACEWKMQFQRVSSLLLLLAFASVLIADSGFRAFLFPGDLDSGRGDTAHRGFL